VSVLQRRTGMALLIDYAAQQTISTLQKNEVAAPRGLSAQFDPLVVRCAVEIITLNREVAGCAVRGLRVDADPRA
jgi:hypothetical protein